MLKVSRLAGIFLVAASLGGCGSLSTFEGFFTAPADTTGSVRQASGKAYIFRGMGGRIASFEMDRLTEKLEKSGIDAETYNHFNWSGPADEAIARYKRQNGNFPIMLVGHSAGADASVYFAQKLKNAGVPVSLIVSFDPTRRPKAVPPNVDRFINIYQSLNFFGGGFVAPGSDFRGHYASVDLKNYWEVLHVNMVKMRGLQDQIIAKMVQIVNMPPQLEGATVPIHYVMPRGEKIELWDSGLPIRTEGPETVRSIAAKYAVPAWAVAQINNLNPSDTLEPGHRLIIPRHLEAAPSMTGPLTSFAPRH
jgi:predicted alpha/beta hydrolase family esterase